MSKNKELSINKIDCTACMGCVEICPEIFEWDDINEEVILKRDLVNEEEVAEAISLCPQDCIELHCASGTE